jgi:2-succinyl-6-hydroxy-2,4-cyclohexadiene-1-carboxylate synthase
VNRLARERVETAAGTLAFRFWEADNEQRAPLVVLHGFTGSSADWSHLAERWSTDRNVVAFDLPGHGATEMGNPAAPCDMSAFADAMNQALIQLDIAQFDLLGYSLGGRAAHFFSTSNPHAVRPLVLERASPGLPDEPQRTPRRAADARLIERL